MISLCFSSSSSSYYYYYHLLLINLILILTAFPYYDHEGGMVHCKRTSISKRFHFRDFRPEDRVRREDIRLLGSAAVDPVSGTVTFPAADLNTNVAPDVAGRALYSAPVRMLNPDTMSSASFETTFTARLASGAGGGLAFLIVPDELTVGRAGAWLGMMNDGCDEGYRHLAVEFDTYQNREFRDPNDNHVGINLASIVSNWTADASAANVSLGDGSMLRSWIAYDSNLTRIEIRVAREGEAKPVEPLLSVFTDLAPLMNEYMFVGFSASGSKRTQVHSWNFSSSLLSRLRFPNEDTCETRFISSAPKAMKRPHPRAFIIFILVALGLLVVFVNLACVPWRRIRDFPNLKKLKLIFTMKKLKKKRSSRKLILRRRPSPFLHRPRRFTQAEILDAHKDFIPDSSFFTASLSDGTQVAVKRFSLEDCSSPQKVMKEIGYLSRLHHPNLVPLRGWCKAVSGESSEVFLVYEYMANGNLHDWLHGDAVLPWVRRHKIVKEVANALAYMHMGAHKMLLHKDVSTKNVLLDAAFRARLGDFCPTFSPLFTTKWDVYCFGAMILEIVSGRSTEVPKRNEEESKTSREKEEGEEEKEEEGLVQWVWRLNEEGRLMEAADCRIGVKYSLEQVLSVLQVGLLCTHSNPRARPDMDMVLKYLSSEECIPNIKLEYQEAPKPLTIAIEAGVFPPL